ncbi:MAG: cysteine hydrolase [Bdellovibrionaceae bacterium]|nr:cysteine hydrolase [Pseudobdellovibrionaceae bacterium]
MLLVDVQNGFNSPSWGERDTPEAELNISMLLKIFRQKNRHIYHVQHLSKNPTSPLRPAQSGVDFMDTVKPIFGERIFQKHVNSSFIGTQLEEVLRQEDIQSLVVVGISVDHCVSTTVRMAANLGFEVFVISDATIAHERKGFDGTLYKAELVHAITLASLHGEFATVLTTTDLIDLLGEKI